MKTYESKKIYSKKYNKLHKTVKIDKDIHDLLLLHLKNKLNNKLTVKNYIEVLIKESIKLIS